MTAKNAKQNSNLDGLTIAPACRITKMEKESMEPTRVFYIEPKAIDGNIQRAESELDFIKWTPQYLIVKYPPTSLRAGKPWKMGRNLVNYWLQEKKLRITGNIPEWALIQ